MKKYRVEILWSFGAEIIAEVPDDFDKDDVKEIIHQNEDEIRDALDDLNPSIDLWMGQDDGTDKVEGKASSFEILEREIQDIDIKEDA